MMRGRELLDKSFNLSRDGMIFGKVIHREFVEEFVAEAEAELNRTKRALWLARAKRAKELQWLNGSKWVIVEQKCRAYADKFKEEKK